MTTLIHLLQEDYLKMTAGFFFRILQTMCDEVDEIKVLDFSYFFGNVNVLFENLDSLSETILILLFFCRT